MSYGKILVNGRTLFGRFPFLPISGGRFRHADGGFSQPILQPGDQIFFNAGNGLSTAQMNIRRFPAHSLK